MEFRQLEAFIKVVELGSFSKAARELHVSQPSISTYISGLERELGTTLLNRSTKTVSSTLAGERFLVHAKKLITLRSASIDAMKVLNEDHSGEIRIVASSVPASYLLPRILADFHALYPKVSFVVEQADTAAAVLAIAKNRAHIGFAGSIIENPACKFEEFADEELIFIGPTTSTAPATPLSSAKDFRNKSSNKDRNLPGIEAGPSKHSHNHSRKHNRSHNKVHTLEELLYAGNFISREVGSGTRIQYEKFFESKGIDLGKINSCASMGDTQSIINSVAAGLGISIVSELAARDAITQGLVSELRSEHKVAHRKIYRVLNTKIEHSHLINLFLEYLG